MVETEILSVLTVFWDSLINFLPKLVGASILLLIGWIIGKAVGIATKNILKRLRIDHYLVGGKGQPFKLSEILSTIFSWAIYLAFIQAAVQILEIAVLVSIFGAILKLIVGLIGAITVIIAGYIIGGYIGYRISESKIIYSDVIANIVLFLVLYIAIAMALPLIGLDATLLNNILLIIVGSFGLGLAIAIGLGLKDVVAAVAKKMMKKKLK